MCWLMFMRRTRIKIKWIFSTTYFQFWKMKIWILWITNCPLDPLLDKKGGASTNSKSVISCVDDFKSKLDLVDIWSLATNKWKFYQVRKWMFRKRGNVMLTKTGCNYSTWEKWKRSRSNVDTKIMSKVIAARVKKVLPSIIHYK